MEQLLTANRYHDISVGHRVFGHENKCAHLHGHNYRIHFSLASSSEALDIVGRVIDFSVIKAILCEWLEQNYDHKFLVWLKDPLCDKLKALDPEGVVFVKYNPTAENIAKYLLEISVKLLEGTGTYLAECTIEETRKCSVTIKSNIPC